MGRMVKVYNVSSIGKTRASSITVGGVRIPPGKFAMVDSSLIKGVSKMALGKLDEKLLQIGGRDPFVQIAPKDKPVESSKSPKAIVPPSEPTVAPSTDPDEVANFLDPLLKAQLVDLCGAVGVDSDGTKAELKSKLTEVLSDPETFDSVKDAFQE